MNLQFRTCNSENAILSFNSDPSSELQFWPLILNPTLDCNSEPNFWAAILSHNSAPQFWTKFWTAILSFNSAPSSELQFWALVLTPLLNCNFEPNFGAAILSHNSGPNSEPNSELQFRASILDQTLNCDSEFQFWPLFWTAILSVNSEPNFKPKCEGLCSWRLQSKGVRSLNLKSRWQWMSELGHQNLAIQSDSRRSSFVILSCGTFGFKQNCSDIEACMDLGSFAYKSLRKTSCTLEMELKMAKTQQRKHGTYRDQNSSLRIQGSALQV